MVEDKIRGGIFGVAVGDALGATVEFMKKEEIKDKYGRHSEIIGGGWLSLNVGETTDDTAMTIAVAEGIIANPTNPIHEIGLKFVEWFRSEPKSIGNTIKLTISNYLKYNNWEKAAMKTREELNGRTAGNGSLMRTLPISFVYSNDLKKMSTISGQVSMMTHYDIKAELSCIFYNRYASYLINAKDKKESFVKALQNSEQLFSGNEGEKLYSLLNSALEMSLSQVKPTGYVVDSLIAAIVAFLSYDNFEEILIEIVNIGGDADTTGAIAGGLAGTFYGYQSIPKRWLKKLSDKNKLEKVVSQLLQICN
ncbi:hypothetical protein BHF71_02265 [Vulcanibacillus modesticaldus]|uniref:ADP-ribosyl-[dinitrogen reductase] hydrolase n=2 Tax=Vulcanibacillus modesticaldus TaxID=337097 RepID=A0A1D2YTY8_9BACI|nr:hypothetical protein BHF71_02265 [Vulcanibacillus modesticaldus]